MYILFSKLVNMSIYGGLFILGVLIVRLILAKAPKRLTILLWGLVAIRLLVPVNIGSNLSIFNLFNVFGEKKISEGLVEYTNTPEKPELIFPVIQAQVLGHEPDIYLPFVVQIWIVGMAVFAIYAIWSYINLKRKVSVSIEEEGLYLCDSINSPFILGLVSPQIYIPSNLNPEIKSMVLSHEKMHIKRLDFIWKVLGFIVLVIHWFNPLVWIGFIFFGRDMEFACDESVIRDMKDEEKIRYSEALLACATRGGGISPCPVAFGEIGVKERIKMVLKYKKSHAVIAVIAMVCVIVCGFCFLTSPVNANVRIDENEIPYADFIGDNSTVSAIVSHMVLPAGYEYDHIELDTKEEPYGLTIVLSGSGDADSDLLFFNADIAFEHIGNLSDVSFINNDTGEVICAVSKAEEGTYLPNETITNYQSDNTDSKDTEEYNVVDYIYNVDEDLDRYSLYALRHMTMDFYEAYMAGDLKSVQSYIARISSISPTVFEGDPGKTVFLGMIDADKVVSGESKIMYLAFLDKNNDEGTKKFLELHITKEPDGWKIFGYDTVVEN